MIRKHIEVVAAIIQKGNAILATQRGYGDLKDGWEFPGGKVEPGESHDEALIREIKEELQADINVVERLILLLTIMVMKNSISLCIVICAR